MTNSYIGHFDKVSKKLDKNYEIFLRTHFIYGCIYIPNYDCTNMKSKLFEKSNIWPQLAQWCSKNNSLKYLWGNYFH